jgi:hypothetical protein
MRLLLPCLAAALLTACTANNTERIVGHWEAESFQLQGLGLPIGPQLDIDAHALRVSGTEVSVPITRMSSKGDAITLVVPAGIDLTFHFERTDRMYIDLPLLGPIFYQRRAPASAPALAATKTAATAPVVAPAPAPAPVMVTPAATAAPVTAAEQSFARAVMLAQNNEADAALRQLDDALQQGFRDWARLDTNPTLHALSTDPRYDALMARWRTL